MFSHPAVWPSRFQMPWIIWLVKKMINLSWHLNGEYVAAHGLGASTEAQLVYTTLKAKSQFIIILTNPTLLGLGASAETVPGLHRSWPSRIQAQWIVWYVKIMIKMTGHLNWTSMRAQPVYIMIKASSMFIIILTNPTLLDFLMPKPCTVRPGYL